MTPPHSQNSEQHSEQKEVAHAAGILLFLQSEPTLPLTQEEMLPDLPMWQFGIDKIVPDLSNVSGVKCRSW
jgi:hypothetical protein